MIAEANRAVWSRLSGVVLVSMAVGLALFSRVEALPVRLPALALFTLLALLRPNLMLLFVPLTAPMYLIGVLILGLRATETRLPLHEIALLLCLAATTARAALDWLLSLRAENREPRTENREPRSTALPLYRSTAWSYAPQGLFLLAGLGGVLLAVERGPAVIELRRLIIEPLIFYGLLRWHLGRSLTPQAVAGACVAGGALAALVGLLQVAGIDLIWMFGDKATVGAAENLVEAGGVLRATSFYGHPNNLGLGLGRIWPLGAALALASWRRGTRGLAWLSGLAALLCLAGLAVSFSRGAWLGAVAAAAVLALGLISRPGTNHQPPTTNISGPQASGQGPAAGWRPAVLLVGALAAGAIVLVLGLGVLLRGGLGEGSGSARLLLWREALGYIQQHPLGLGLDQFLYYHHPQYGRSLADPALLRPENRSELFAAHPHNMLLDAWLRVGPLGLLAFGWLITRYIRAGLLALRGPTMPALIALGALAALAAALTHGLVDNFYFVGDLALAFWMLLALVEHSAQAAP